MNTETGQIYRNVTPDALRELTQKQPVVEVTESFADFVESPTHSTAYRRKLGAALEKVRAANPKMSRRLQEQLAVRMARAS